MARSSNQPDWKPPVEAPGLSDERTELAPQSAAVEERGPADSGVQAPKPPQSPAEWSTGAPQSAQSTKPRDESKFHSRNTRELLRGRVPRQKFEKYKRFQQVIGREMQLLIEEAMDDLLLKYSFGAPPVEHQCSTINDLDDLTTAVCEEHTQSSDQLFPDSGALEHHTPEQQKEIDVLNYYAAKTGNQIRERDRHAYRTGHKESPGIADVPVHVIQLGIKESILACESRVNSLSYCLHRIHRLAAKGASQEMDEFLERTFSIQLEAKQNPRMDREELTLRLRMAARGNQQMLPSVGADLVEGRFQGSEFDKATVLEFARKSHNWTLRWNRLHPEHPKEGIRNPEGWAATRFRTGEDDELIQEWLDDPEMFERPIL